MFALTTLSQLNDLFQENMNPAAIDVKKVIYNLWSKLGEIRHCVIKRVLQMFLLITVHYLLDVAAAYLSSFVGFY